MEIGNLKSGKSCKLGLEQFNIPISKEKLQIVFATEHVTHQVDRVDCGAYIMYSHKRVLGKTWQETVWDENCSDEDFMETVFRDVLQQWMTPFVKIWN